MAKAIAAIASHLIGNASLKEKKMHVTLRAGFMGGGDVARLSFRPIRAGQCLSRLPGETGVRAVLAKIGGAVARCVNYYNHLSLPSN